MYQYPFQFQLFQLKKEYLFLLYIPYNHLIINNIYKEYEKWNPSKNNWNNWNWNAKST